MYIICNTEHVYLTVSTFTCGFIHTTGAIIGFENISVSVEEGAGFVVIYVAVLNGALGGDVTVRFSTSDLSATGEPYCHLIQHEVMQ